MIGDTVEMRGRIARTSGASFVNGGGGHPGGYLMYSLDAAQRPQREQRFITASAGLKNQSMTVVTVYTNGEVRAQPVDGSASWLSLDGVRFPLKD